ncbi:MAG: adenylate/guanylate cyclase domain-containing protein [Actinomycetota bacterium]
MAADLDPELIALFESIGVPEAEIPPDISAQSALASDAVLARGDHHSLRDLGATLDLEVEHLCVVFAEMGIRITDFDQVRFDDRDLELLRFVTQATDQLYVENEGDEILNVVGSTLETLAEAAIASHVQGPERRLRSDADGVRLNADAATLGLLLADALPMVFRHHLRQAATRQRRTQNHDHRELVELTVGFVDLVGFTALSQSLESLELVDFVRTFERAAHAAARRYDTRIAKLIGDEVMFVAESPASATDFATDLIATFQADGVVPRGGVAQGSIITLHGDYFGPVVNLAARLVGAAVPAEVLVTEAVAHELAERAVPSGRRMLKGFPEPVAVWSVTS